MPPGIYPARQSDCCLQDAEWLHLWHDYTHSWGSKAVSWTVYESDNQLYVCRRHITLSPHAITHEEKPLRSKEFARQMAMLMPVIEGSDIAFPAFDADFFGVRARRPDGSVVERTWYHPPRPALQRLAAAVSLMLDYLDGVIGSS